MLHNPNWKPTIAPVEVPVIEPWRQILQEVADVIEQRGWQRNDFQSLTGRVCAIGAFRVVLYGDGNASRSKHRKYDAHETTKAKQKFWAAIPENEKSRYPRESWSEFKGGVTEKIMSWNDCRCRSKKAIIGSLRKAAAG